MRYAIVSDLHANLQAWNAVLTDIGSNGADRILCLGDVVGYGPDPAAVMSSAHRHVHAFVLGNHDAVLCGKMSADMFNDRARRMIEWTREQLDRTARDFLSKQPLSLLAPGFRCTHGTFVNPAAFDYMIDPEDAALSWQSVPEQLLFVGHSHTPGIFVLGGSGTPHKLEPQDFVLEPEKRYIVNVGSVGAPRDEDTRASYVLYDEESGAILFRRIPFDMDSFRSSVSLAGLDVQDVPMLRRDPRLKLVSVREALDFSPAQEASDEAHNVLAEADIERIIRQKTAHWRHAAWAALTLAVLGTAGAFIYARSDRPQKLVVPSEAPPPVSTDAKQSVQGGFLPALPDAVGADGGIRPWRIFYGDKRTQTVTVMPDDSAYGQNLLLRGSGEKTYMRIEAPPIMLDDSLRKFLIFGEIKRSASFEGRIGLTFDLMRVSDDGRDEWIPQYYTVEFRQQSGTPLERARKTTDNLPKYAIAARVALEGNFTGEVEIHSLRLTSAITPQY